LLLAGAGRAGAAGGGAAVADIFIQAEKQRLIEHSEFQQYESAFAAWDELYETVMFMDAGANIGLLIRNVATASCWSKFVSKVDDLPDDVVKTDLKVFIQDVKSGEAIAGEITAISNRLDNLFAMPQTQPFINDLINFSTGNSGRIARFGDISTLKNTITNLIENPIVNNVKSYDLLINDIEHFMINYRSVPGALNYFDELLQTPLKFKGGAFGIEILSNPPPVLAGKTLIKLESGIDDIDNFRYDLMFEDGSGMKIFVETKNYSSGTGFTTSFYNQFKAYISNPQLENMDQLKYFFRSNDGVTKATQVKKFKNMMKSNAKELFESNPSLFRSIKKENGIDFIDDWDDLKTMMESPTISIDHPVFNFIEMF